MNERIVTNKIRPIEIESSSKGKTKKKNSDSDHIETERQCLYLFFFLSAQIGNVKLIMRFILCGNIYAMNNSITDALHSSYDRMCRQFNYIMRAWLCNAAGYTQSLHTLRFENMYNAIWSCRSKIMNLKVTILVLEYYKYMVLFQYKSNRHTRMHVAIKFKQRVTNETTTTTTWRYIYIYMKKETSSWI